MRTRAMLILTGLWATSCGAGGGAGAGAGGGVFGTGACESWCLQFEAEAERQMPISGIDPSTLPYAVSQGGEWVFDAVLFQDLCKEAPKTDDCLECANWYEDLFRACNTCSCYEDDPSRIPTCCASCVDFGMDSEAQDDDGVCRECGVGEPPTDTNGDGVLDRCVPPTTYSK